jgi:hypothetical protein
MDYVALAFALLTVLFFAPVVWNVFNYVFEQWAEMFKDIFGRK